MPTEMTWTQSIASADIGSAPTALTDANVVPTSSAYSVLALSATITGGTDPVVTVVVYFWNPVQSTFELTGDVFTLDPATSNVRVLSPEGLVLGFTATVTGSPSSFSIDIGKR